MAVAVVLGSGAVGLIWRKVIMIARGATQRQQLRQMCSEHDRYLIYPEGTRRANKPDADEPCALKVGGLKNVYEAGDALLIMVTVNKELLMNEGRCQLRCCTTLYRARDASVRAADHANFESFHTSVERAWVATWQRAYALREQHERPARSAPRPSDSDDPGSSVGSGGALETLL